MPLRVRPSLSAIAVPFSTMNNRERHEQVRGQIAARLELLQRWRADGVPEDRVLPRSLNQVRCWDDPDLGISRIGSPASFTTKHREHGASVRAIAEVLEVLLKREREAKPKEPSLASQLKDERRRSAALKKMFACAADQYAAIVVEFEEISRELRVTRQSLESVTAENSELRQEVRDRSRRLSQYSDSRRVAHIHPRPAS